MSSTRVLITVRQTIRVTKTFRVIVDGTTTSPHSMITQTKPVDLKLQMVPTDSSSVVPDMTAVPFLHSYSSLISQPMPVTSVASDVELPSDTPPSRNMSKLPESISSAAIAGIALGALALVCITLALVLCLHHRRIAKASTNNEHEKPSSEELLEVRVQRAQDLGMQRWSMSHTRANKRHLENMKAKKAAAAEMATDEESNSADSAKGSEKNQSQRKPEKTPAFYDRSRRPSALAMHPPTPATVQFKGGEGGYLDKSDKDI